MLPPPDDYSMEGKTYRYFEGETLCPFGYGLSYTTLRELQGFGCVPLRAGEKKTVESTVTRAVAEEVGLSVGP